MSKAAKKSSPALAVPAIAARPARQAPAETTSKKADPGSKQSRVIAMLQSSTGATIAAMMKTTGWQQHSVRGFLAGVVRKRLKLKLNSKKVDGNRVYRIAGGGRGKTGARPSKASRPKRYGSRKDRSCPAGPETHSMSRLRGCAISTSASFGLVGAASFGGIRPLTYLVIFCFAFWHIGCRPIIWVTWMVRAQRLLDRSGSPEKAGQRAVDLSRRTASLRPGTMLGREWNGQMQRVAVLADGFAWNGKTYPSLSKVAFAITGTRWNGPKFFGLRDKPSKEARIMKAGSAKVGSLRDLYPRVDRPRARAGLQLARRPV